MANPLRAAARWVGRKLLDLGRTRPARQTAAQRKRAATIRAKYDAAQTNDQNKNHWSNADHLNADGANNPYVRSTLRARSRYEAANSGYTKGLLRTVRNDVIGTGPRLQVALPGSFTHTLTYVDPDFDTTMSEDVTVEVQPDAARRVERAFRRWADGVNLAGKLRVAEETLGRDGECFGVLITNEGLADSPVKLDLTLIEPDQVSTPDLVWNDPLATDGIRYDQFGNPVEYHVLKQHPGAPTWVNPWDYDRIDARYVLHWMDPDRPGQRRGVPKTTPGLPLGAQLRRFTGAVLAAAETAANHAAMLETTLPPPGDGDPAATEDEQPEDFDRIPLPQNGAVTLPAGWKMSAFDSKQPQTTYPQFKAEVLTEIGAGFGAPRNVSTKSSAEYNYSSARLDHLPYRQDIRITRDDRRRAILDRVFRAWYAEARTVRGYLPADLPPFAEWDWTWQWDGFESIDPQKDATADDTGLKNGTRTLPQILAEKGIDAEEHLRQLARTIGLARRLEREEGLTPGTLYPLTPAEAAAPPPTEAPADADAATAA